MSFLFFLLHFPIVVLGLYPAKAKSKINYTRRNISFQENNGECENIARPKGLTGVVVIKRFILFSAIVNNMAGFIQTTWIISGLIIQYFRAHSSQKINIVKVSVLMSGANISISDLQDAFRSMDYFRCKLTSYFQQHGYFLVQFYLGTRGIEFYWPLGITAYSDNQYKAERVFKKRAQTPIIPP